MRELVASPPEKRLSLRRPQPVRRIATGSLSLASRLWVALPGLLFLLSACAKRMPPPVPSAAKEPAPAAKATAPASAPDRAADLPSSAPSEPRVFANPGAGAAAAPADVIVASPWADHAGTEERIEWWLDFWQTRSRGPIQRALNRMGRYEAYVIGEIEARGLPLSLRYLPIIEAAYFPRAVSRAGAGGLWQFMPPTARWLGLEINSLIDERFDPYLATPLALDYLSGLYRQFGSWFLALAAYNSGPGRVERTIDQHVREPVQGDELFWRIHPHLPPETRDFIPKYLAAARLAENPEGYGFDTGTREEPQRFDEVGIRGAASVDVIAEVAGATEEALRVLNPQLVLGLTPAGETTPVRLPTGSGEGFATRFAAVPEDERVTLTRHRVVAGETLSHIARQYRVSVATLRTANPEVQPRRMQIGTVLIIPR